MDTSIDKALRTSYRAARRFQWKALAPDLAAIGVEEKRSSSARPPPPALE